MHTHIHAHTHTHTHRGDEGKFLHYLSMCTHSVSLNFQTNLKRNTPLSTLKWRARFFSLSVYWVTLITVSSPLSLSLSVFTSSSRLSFICCSTGSEATACVCLDHDVATVPSMHSCWVQGIPQCNPSRPLVTLCVYPPLCLCVHPSLSFSFSLFLFTQSTTDLPSPPPCIFSSFCVCAILMRGGLLASYVAFFFLKTTSVHQLIRCLQFVTANTFVFTKTKK